MGSQLQLIRLGIQLVHDDIAAALLCLDQAFHQPLRLETASSAKAAEVLQAFLVYAKTLKWLACSSDESGEAALRRLLAFSANEGGGFSIRGDSLLADVVTKSSRRGNEIRINRVELRRCVKTALKDRLLAQVRTLNSQAKCFRAMKVCLQYAVERGCKAHDCQRAHVASYDHAAYQDRVALLLLQIHIYQAVSGLEERDEQLEQRR